ncbi:hypothetical protein, partial [Escherichia coli]
MTNEERAAIDHVATAPMLAQVEAWSAINSGTRNLAGLAQMAELLVAAFGTLPGEPALVVGNAAQNVAPDGTVTVVEHGKHLHLVVRSDAPVQILL